MKRQFVTLSIRAGALMGLLIVSLHGCTNLEEKPVSVITPGSFFGNEAEVSAALAGVYAQLRSTAPEGTIYDANEVSTDEIVVPIRGPDWIDNGQWIDLHNQTWTPTSAAASNFFNGAWNNYFLPFVMLNHKETYNLPLGIAALMSATGTRTSDFVINEPEHALAALVMIIPVMIIFLVAQKYIVQGLAAGSVKE